MESLTHAASGVLAYATYCRLIAEWSGTHLGLGQVILGATLTAGAAIANDLDTPGFSAARSFGAPTRLVAAGVKELAVVHRYGTHCLAGIAVITALIAWATTAGVWVPGVIIWLLLGFAFKALRLGHWIDDLRGVFGAAACAGMVAVGLVLGHVDLRALPFIVATGLLAHSIGDSLTEYGVPWAWPFTRRRFNLGPRRADSDSHERPRRHGLFTTGSTVERRLVAPLIVAATIAVSITQLHAWQRIADEVQRMGVRTATRHTTLHGPVAKPVYVATISRRRVAVVHAEVEGEITNGIA